MEKEVLFSETQKFRQWWLWLVMLLIFGILLFIVFKIMDRDKLEDNMIPLTITGLSVLFVLLPTAVLLFNLKLETRVKEDGIYVRFFPFHLTFKEYKWNDISKSFVRQYNPLSEFGGWGLRFGPGGKAFNVSGNKGLQLEFRDNKKLLIGTNKPDELVEALRQIGQLKQ